MGNNALNFFSFLHMTHNGVEFKKDCRNFRYNIYNVIVVFFTLWFKISVGKSYATESENY